MITYDFFENFYFLVVKCSIYLNRHVFEMQPGKRAISVRVTEFFMCTECIYPLLVQLVLVPWLR